MLLRPHVRLALDVMHTVNTTLLGDISRVSGLFSGRLPRFLVASRIESRCHPKGDGARARVDLTQHLSDLVHGASPSADATTPRHRQLARSGDRRAGGREDAGIARDPRLAAPRRTDVARRLRLDGRRRGGLATPVETALAERGCDR